MATNESPLPPGISVTERLWSEECAIADADSPMGGLSPDNMPGYEFSNGVKFKSGNGHYEPSA